MRRAYLLVPLLAVLVVACSRDDEPSTATTTQRPVSSTTTTAEPACPEADLPTNTAALSEAGGDVDGDGRADVLSTYLVDDAEWHLHVELARGGGADVALDAFASEAVTVLGGADVDGDGADEIWARTGAGASATILGLARFANCTLTQVTFIGGRPAEFAIGGSVGTASGLACEVDDDVEVVPDAHLTAFTATNSGDDQYEIEATGYTLDGAVLVRTGTETTSVSSRDPAFRRATGFGCGSLVF